VVGLFDPAQGLAPDCSFVPVHVTYGPRMAANLGGLDYWNDSGSLDPAYHASSLHVGDNPELMYERCGATQRMSYWDDLCTAVAGEPVASQWDWPTDPMSYDPATGIWWSEAIVANPPPSSRSEPRCSVMHPRGFKSACSVGQCDAGFTCDNSIEPPLVVTFDKADDISCGDVTEVGCCIGDVLRKCHLAYVVETTCETDTGDPLRGCGWGGSAYGCGSNRGVEDPSLTYPLVCPLPTPPP
jgi:hypothetical protein